MLPPDWIITSAGGDFGGRKDLQLPRADRSTCTVDFGLRATSHCLAPTTWGCAAGQSTSWSGQPRHGGLRPDGDHLDFSADQDSGRLEAISSNLIAVPPTPEAVAEAIGAGVARTEDLEGVLRAPGSRGRGKARSRTPRTSWQVRAR